MWVMILMPNGKKKLGSRSKNNRDTRALKDMNKRQNHVGNDFE